MFKFFPHTEEDLQAMMEKAGVERLDDLYAQIPETIRFRGDYQFWRCATCLRNWVRRTSSSRALQALACTITTCPPSFPVCCSAQSS